MPKKKVCSWCKEVIRIQPGKKSKRYYKVVRKGKTYYFCKSNHEDKYAKKYFHRHDTYEVTRRSKDSFAKTQAILEGMRKDGARNRKRREKRERKIYLSLAWWQKLLVNIGLKRLWDYET